MSGSKNYGSEFGQEHLGVWDPTGGEARNGSGLPVEEGVEEIQILRSAEGSGIHEVMQAELGSFLGNLGRTLWIDILRPREGARTLLQKTLELGPLTVEDCLAPLRMPKMDVFKEENEETQGAFVAAFALSLLKSENEVQLRAIEVDLVVGPNYLVTVRDVPAPELSRRVESSLRTQEPSKDSGQILAYEALDALIDGHLPVLVSAAAAAEELEESLDPRNERISITALENLIALKRDLSAFHRLAVAQQETLRRLGRDYVKMRSYLSDVADNQRETVDMADATRDYVDGAVEAYRMRRDEWAGMGIRRLTVLAGVFGPLTVFVGWYGTNFSYIPGVDTPYGFYAFVGIQVLFIAVVLLYLRSRRWF